MILSLFDAQVTAAMQISVHLMLSHPVLYSKRFILINISVYAQSWFESFVF